MKVQLELTDTFGGEANYSWVRRETLVLPDDTDDSLVLMVARDWAGWRGRRTEAAKMGGNDDIEVRPHGLLQVMFVTFNYDDTEAEPREISLSHVVAWVNTIQAALSTEYASLVTPAERAVAAAVCGAFGVTTYDPPMTAEQSAELAKPPLNRSPERMPKYTWKPSSQNDLTRAMHQRDSHRGA